MGNKSERSKKPAFGKRGQVAELKRKPSLLERLRGAMSRRWSGKKSSDNGKRPRGKGLKRSRLGK